MVAVRRLPRTGSRPDDGSVPGVDVTEIILDDPKHGPSEFGPVCIIRQADGEPVRRAVNRLARGSFTASGFRLPRARWKKSTLDAEKRLARLLREADAGLLPLFSRTTLTGTRFNGATGEGAYVAVGGNILNHAAMAEIARRMREDAL